MCWLTQEEHPLQPEGHVEVAGRGGGGGHVLVHTQHHPTRGRQPAQSRLIVGHFLLYHEGKQDG